MRSRDCDGSCCGSFRGSCCGSFRGRCRRRRCCDRSTLRDDGLSRVHRPGRVDLHGLPHEVPGLVSRAPELQRHEGGRVLRLLHLGVDARQALRRTVQCCEGPAVGDELRHGAAHRVHHGNAGRSGEDLRVDLVDPDRHKGNAVRRAAVDGLQRVARIADNVLLLVRKPRRSVVEQEFVAREVHTFGVCHLHEFGVVDALVLVMEFVDPDSLHTDGVGLRR